jgi:hypothetical protein
MDSTPDLHGDRVSHTTAVVLLGGDGDDVLSPDVAHFTVEQTEAGGDVAEIRVAGTWCNFAVCFVDAAALDRLSLFFAEAAQKLRYCTK